MAEQDSPNELAKAQHAPYNSSAEKEHYAAIGRVAEHWAFFELLVDQRIALVLELPPDRGACLTAHIQGSGRKLEAYCSAVRLRGITKFKEKLERILNAAAKHQRRRNRIVHDAWNLADSENPIRYEVVGGRTLIMRDVPESTQEVLEFSRTITSFMVLFHELHEEILVLALSSQDTQR